MANTREIKSRMNSIQDTMKITNAMYMISSTKLRKAKKNLEETEPYFYTLQSMIARIMRHLGFSTSGRCRMILLHPAVHDSKNHAASAGCGKSLFPDKESSGGESKGFCGYYGG